MQAAAKMMSFMIVPSLLLLSLFLYPNQHLAHAQYFTGPVSSSMGGAGVAAVNASEGVFLNPAVIAHAPNFEASLNYEDGYLARQTHRTFYGVTLVDNSPDVLMPGGFTYFKGSRTFASGTASEDSIWQMSLSTFVARNLSVGMNVFYLQNEITHQQDEKQWNGTLGAHYTLSPRLAVALVYYNPVSQSRHLPVELRTNPHLRAGLQYAPQDFVKMRLDVSRAERDNPQKEGIIYTGVEVDLREFAMFRLGAQFNDYEKRNLITAGLGFNGPRLKINYSFQKSLKGTGGALHGVDFRIPVW